MHRILLLIQNRENHRLLTACLSKDYEIVSSGVSMDVENPELSRCGFDLCLVDGVSLSGTLPWLTAMRAEAAPLWLPVLLVVPKGKIGQVAHQCWQSVDEVIAVPVEKAELMTRIGVLLRARQLSKELFEMNQTLKQRNEQLQELNQLKSQFVSMVSHEFQNPLGTISGFLQLLIRQGDKLSAAKRQEYIERALASLNHLKTLVHDVLIIGRVGVGKLRFEPVIANLVQLCRDLVEEIRFNAQQPCALNLSVAAGAETALSAVMIDTNLLRQIVTNLLTNALKYSSKGSPVEFSLAYEDNQAVLRIHDQGIGIPVQEQPKLFEPFYRASNVGTRPGSGLGLAITRQCVGLHGGEITFTSEREQGTTFEVRLTL